MLYYYLLYSVHTVLNYEKLGQHCTKISGKKLTESCCSSTDVHSRYVSAAVEKSLAGGRRKSPTDETAHFQIRPLYRCYYLYVCVCSVRENRVKSKRRFHSFQSKRRVRGLYKHRYTRGTASPPRARAVHVPRRFVIFCRTWTLKPPSRPRGGA